MDERVSLITTIFSDHNQVRVVRDLSGDGAQAFIDIIDGVSLCTLLPPKNSIDFYLNLRTLLARPWIMSRYKSARSVCALYTGFVAARP